MNPAPAPGPDLARILKRLKLSGIAATLPARATYALDHKLHPLAFLELCLSDEIERRDANNIRLRIERANLEEITTIERFDWNAGITIDRARVTDLFNLGFLHRSEDIIFQGPTGVGKTLLASALAHAAIRAGHRVQSIRSDTLLKTMHQSRADHSTERVLRSFLTPTLLLIDDFGLKRLNAQQSSDLYEIIIERHKRASTIITSNRAIDEWIPLFDDPLLAQSALDRLAHNAHQITIEGPSYRGRQRPGRTPPTTTT
jgi:DNA replication protein DnaC